MIRSFRIGDRIIGDYGRPFIIAEAGINHSGDFKTAKGMIDAAAKTGADAVSFQHIDAGDFNVEPGDVKYWDSLRLTKLQMAELFRQAKSAGLSVTACVINHPDLELIVDLGADFIKIVSGDITCLPFLRECARTGLPVFMSTGAAEIREVKEAVKSITSAGNKKLVIYHTCTNYPTPLEEVNLDIIDYYKKEFDFPIGYCDHTEGDFVPKLAAAKGIAVLEKHFTLDRNKKGPDYEVSLLPWEFKAMTEEIRKICLVRGRGEKHILNSEKNKYLKARRSIVAKRDIPRGTVISRDKLTYKRPGAGLQPNMLNKVLGKVAKVNIKDNEYVTLKKVKK